MASVIEQAPARRPTTSHYQTLLVGLLGVNMGFVFLDRGAFGLLAPLIQPEFHLDNTDIGLVNGALAVTWSLSSFGLCRAADATGRSKTLLIAGTVIFSIASISSGLAAGLLTLIAARALMGIAEGGLPPLSTHIVSAEVPAERRGLAIGALSTLGINAIPLLGPLVVVGIGQLFGWREAFWVAGIPGLIMAGVIWAVVRHPPYWKDPDAPAGSVLPLLKVPNIRVSMATATLNMSCFVISTGFLPLYLVKILGLSNAMMGVVVTVSTACSIAYGFFGPTLSDRYGRRPIVIACFLIAIAGYTLIAFSGGALPVVFLGAIGGIATTGPAILVMNVIAGESAPPHLTATAMGFNAAVGEMIGAGGMAVVIGAVADRFGLGVLPWIFVTFAGLVVVVTLLALKETAPNVVARRAMAKAI